MIDDYFGIHKKEKWVGQYKRIERWVKKYNDFDPEQINDISNQEEYFDIIYACFQNIFYLKDWLKESNLFSNTELNEFINNNIEIGICRDICNCTKHFNINHPSVDSNFGFAREFNPMSAINKKPKINLVILANGRTYEVDAIIRKCIELWRDLILTKSNS